MVTSAIRKISVSVLLWITIMLAGSLFDNGDITAEAMLGLFSGFSYWAISLLLLFIVPAWCIWADKQAASKLQKMGSIVAGAFENTTDNLQFTTKLIDGDLAYSYTAKDELGASLVKLRDRLKENEQEEARRKLEDEQRNWATEGQAKFAEILRHNNKDIETLTYAVLKNMVNYLNANQGGVFLFDKESAVFEMVTCYAYGSKKIREKQVKIGEGLIGRIGVEKETIFITDLPDGYMNITSGLGGQKPRSLIIVPIIANEELFGAIEIASFQIFEQYRIDFVEKIAEILGSTIAGVRINLQTASLLQESQKQSRKMQQQEEEMRRNMEDMKRLQKEASKQAEEFVSFSNSVNHTMIRADYDVEGILLYANTKFINKMGYTGNSEVEGQSIFSFINEKDREWFNKIWESLSLGGQHYEGFMKHMTRSGEDLWTLSTYTCVRDENGKVRKILFLAIDTTESKKKSLDFEGIIKALDRSSLKVEIDLEGKMFNANTNIISALGYSVDELGSITLFDIIDVSEKDKLSKVWNETLDHNACESTIAFITKSGAKKWLFGSYTTVRDMYGDVFKVIFVGNDVSGQVMIEQKVAEQNKKLMDQEQLLQNNQLLLEKELEVAKNEMKAQFTEIEKSKVLNEKTLEGAIDAIFTIDGLGKIVFFNSAAEQLWKLSRNEALGRNVRELFAEDTIASDPYIAALADSSKSKIIGARQEVNILTKSGEKMSVLMLISEAEYKNEHTYTAFVQNIEVELF
jgi:PAS domain S-box-containing protein